MTKLLGNKNIKAMNIEIRRGGRSYTIDTVRALKKKYPSYKFFWIIGSDIIKTKSYKKWKDWESLFWLIRFLVIMRPGYEIRKLPPGFILAGTSTKDISSTEIRKRIRHGLPVNSLVRPKIEKYIKKHKLYKK